MKTKVSLKMYVLSVVLLMTSFVASARSYDGQLVYNPVGKRSPYPICL